MSENKTVPTKQSVDAFMEAVEHPTRKADGYKLIEMMGEITGEAPKMWGPSIIGFGSYHYKYESGREGDMPLVGFSPRKARLSLYLMDDFDAHADLLSKLGKHKTSKACLYINKLADVDLDVLKELIKVAAENTARKYAT